MSYFRYLLFAVFIFSSAVTGTAEELPPWDENSLIEYRQPPYSEIESLRQDPRYDYDIEGRRSGWFARLIMMLIDAFSRGMDGNPWFRYVLLGLLLVAFVLFILRLLNIPIVGFIEFAGKGRSTDLLFSSGDASSIDTDMEKMLEMYRGNGAYREAVRIMYLLTLRKLERRGAITLRDTKTNRDYVREISDLKLRRKFSSLVKIYDYVWFGSFDPDEELFGQIEADFTSALALQNGGL